MLSPDSGPFFASVSLRRGLFLRSRPRPRQSPGSHQHSWNSLHSSRVSLHSTIQCHGSVLGAQRGAKLKWKIVLLLYIMRQFKHPSPLPLPSPLFLGPSQIRSVSRFVLYGQLCQSLFLRPAPIRQQSHLLFAIETGPFEAWDRVSLSSRGLRS